MLSPKFFQFLNSKKRFCFGTKIKFIFTADILNDLVYYCNG